ncbi:hypothetical protein BH09ACT8_BH09ACT8_04550 [soil metagenome]
MTTEDAAPLGHIDAGETIYVVIDKDKLIISAHLSGEGARSTFENTAGTDQIIVTSLHR